MCEADKPLLRHMHFRTHMQVCDIERARIFANIVKDLSKLPLFMQAKHLPDETCDICGGDFRPCAFGQHWETCDGTPPSKSRAAQQKKLFRFWVGDSDASSGSRRGRCLLCPSREKLVCHQAFIQHMQVFSYSVISVNCVYVLLSALPPARA